jgi:MraZ protein
MFSGNDAINMDAKGRIAIPTRVRELLHQSCQGQVVLTAHTENRCLHLFPKPHWEEIVPVIESLPSFNQISRKAKLKLIGYASHLELDGNGRILVPPTLREFAALEKKLMLVGQVKGLELWSEQEFNSYINAPVEGEEMPEAMRNLAL